MLKTQKPMVEVISKVHDDRWIVAEQVNAICPNGKKISNFLRLTMKNRGYVLVSAKTTDNRFIFVRQWKIVAGESIESVAGGIELNETVFEAAQRELAEEAGFKPKRIVPVNSFGFYTQTDRIINRAHIVLATRCCPVPINKEDRDEKQDIEFLLLSEQEVRRMILKGKIKDVATIAGFYFFLDFENQLRNR
jgi:ADP-ribose pyrophosphatase